MRETITITETIDGDRVILGTIEQFGPGDLEASVDRDLADAFGHYRLSTGIYRPFQNQGEAEAYVRRVAHYVMEGAF